MYQPFSFAEDVNLRPGKDVMSSNQRQISIKSTKKSDYVQNRNGRPSRYMETDGMTQKRHRDQETP